MSRDKVDLWVGLFVLLGGLALVFLALKAGNLSSFSYGSTYQVTANFDNIGGLKAGAPVKSAGVVVGRVRGIAFDDQMFQGVVTLDMDARYRFPTDSSAKILTSGLLGEQYIGIEPGGDEKNFAQGDKIRYTQSAVVLENLISQFLYSKAAEGPPAGQSAPPAGQPAPAPAAPQPAAP
ncbi:outer membrane lipid asymmetry maintenance protein MlaD [Pigmentiphaga soli]|uniref:Outer membrane lipid asymmetry maintenance protein MlaD n=1 Tax=Pigmentiphaga soli TaxID=1007095 RepID=A0ABP8GIN3_9BURK